MKTFTFSLLAACALAASPLAAQLAAHRPSQQQVLTAEIPGREIRTISLEGADGLARVVTGAGDKIRVQVRVSVLPVGKQDLGDLIRRWFLKSSYETDQDLLHALKMRSQVEASTLKLGLTPPVRSRHQRLREEWTIEVPPRVALDLKLQAADLEVSGVAGGVGADVAVGQVKIDVPGGNVAVSLGVGDAKVRTASDSVRRVELESSVGQTSLWMNGLQMPADREPGAGSEIATNGQGQYTLKIGISVGDAELRIR